MTDEDEKLWQSVTKDVKPLKRDLQSLWHKKIRPPKGLPETFPTVLDLHGKTIQQAYDVVNLYLEQARDRNLRFVKVITGRSGDIATEFPRWIEGHPYIKRHETLNGGGAFKIWIRNS